MPSHFEPAAFTFLKQLSRHNDREWFTPRKAIYEAKLKAPMLAVIEEINTSLASFAPDFVRDPSRIMMRIYRDIRFSKNKLPYKDHLAAWWAHHGMEKTSAAGFYIDINPKTITVAAGCYMPERDQLLAIRNHLLTNHLRFREITAEKKLRKAGFTPLEPAMMTRPPKGFAPDHPAIDLVKSRQWGIAARLPAEIALGPGLLAEITSRFKLAAPLVSLLNEPLLQKGVPNGQNFAIKGIK